MHLNSFSYAVMLQFKWPDDYKSWKSCGVSHSHDNGASWSEGAQFCTTEGPPEQPSFGGTGDYSVIWDPFHRRWLCFYTNWGVCLAGSTDPMVDDLCAVTVHTIPHTECTAYYCTALHTRCVDLPAHSLLSSYCWSLRMMRQHAGAREQELVKQYLQYCLLFDPLSCILAFASRQYTLHSIPPVPRQPAGLACYCLLQSAVLVLHHCTMHHAPALYLSCCAR